MSLKRFNIDAKKLVIGLFVGLAVLFVTYQLFSIDAMAAGKGSIPGVTIDSSGNMKVDGISGGTAQSWNTFIEQYRFVIVGISGIGAVSMVLFFIFLFMKLGATAGNPQARSQVLTGLIWSGVAAAGLGAVSIIVGFFYNAFG